MKARHVLIFADKKKNFSICIDMLREWWYNYPVGIPTYNRIKNQGCFADCSAG